jgi:hypothetical protein
VYTHVREASIEMRFLKCRLQCSAIDMSMILLLPKCVIDSMQSYTEVEHDGGVTAGFDF